MFNQSDIQLKPEVRHDLHSRGYAAIPHSKFILSSNLNRSWRNLRSDWQDLKVDPYMKDGGTYRSRRYGHCFYLPTTHAIAPLPHAPYSQSVEDNGFAGGIARIFEPLHDHTFDNDFLQALIRLSFSQFSFADVSMANQPWDIGIHLIRTVATRDRIGKPTPEGIHHDGLNFTSIHLIRRQNARGGVTTICDNKGRAIKKVTLSVPLDSILIEDPRVMHGVSALMPEDLLRDAIRDVLIFDYQYAPRLKVSKYDGLKELSQS